MGGVWRRRAGRGIRVPAHSPHREGGWGRDEDPKQAPGTPPRPPPSRTLGLQEAFRVTRH